MRFIDKNDPDKVFTALPESDFDKSIAKIIKESIGEQNLYKMDLWKDVGKSCRHGATAFCNPCMKELEGDE